MKLTTSLYRMNARCNTALDAVAEYLVLAMMILACESGRAWDRLIFRCRTRVVCCWCKRTLRHRLFFWQRDASPGRGNVSHGICPACLEKHFPSEN